MSRLRPLPLLALALFLVPLAGLAAAQENPAKPAIQETLPSLENAQNAQAVLSFLKINLTPDQKRFLNANKFLLVPKRDTIFGQNDHDAAPFSLNGYDYDEMLGLFDRLGGDGSPLNRKPENTKFVGPDVVLHAMGKYFENALEYLEKTELAPLLTRFVAALRDRALAHRKTASGALANHLETVAAQLTVPLVLLENVKAKTPPKAGEMPVYGDDEVPDNIDTPAAALKRLAVLSKPFSPPTVAALQTELRRIYEAEGMAPSPLFRSYDPEGRLKADYTQYKPRGHYAKNSRLRGYFRAMMFLGRMGWPLGTPAGLSDALIVTELLDEPGKDGKPLSASWKRLMDVTGFFAGLPDDTDYEALRAFVLKALGQKKLSLADAVNPKMLGKLAGRLDELPTPRILSDILVDPSIPKTTKEATLAQLKNFRLFGQRFSPDAWILSRLTAGQEQTDVRLPSMPSALFVPAALGNATAREFTAAFLAGPGQNFSPDEVTAFLGRLDATAKGLASLPEKSWSDSLAAAWLHVLSTLKTNHGPGWPAYMQSPPFPAKRIETILGSYTELKHATVLYAKQNYAESGDGGEEGTPPPVPKGFVEPAPDFWAAMGKLIGTVKAGFAHYKLLPAELEEYGRLSEFNDLLAFYGSLAAKEMANQPLSEEEYEKLRTQGLGFMSAPFEMVILTEDQYRSGLTADIHTDAVTGQVLYEATGMPYVMLVLVGNENSPRLTVGTAYNQYEFARPLSEGRLTDEAWRADAYARPPRLPAKNAWYKDLDTQ
ncbi:DUF3160 domain-containing protein [Solidesulfovibrio sp. C21]|uniref:DUF3160 domain-containing protein n=1 Tax=Solidesulfovibrio sp. C21 TaxID=3398613 RepID=UPI0039FC23BF